MPHPLKRPLLCYFRLRLSRAICAPEVVLTLAERLQHRVPAGFPNIATGVSKGVMSHAYQQIESSVKGSADILPT
jgi:hypothetical protein